MFVLSISYKNAPVDVREMIAFSKEEQISFAQEMVKDNAIEGSVVISTCNRMEIYISGTHKTLDLAERHLQLYAGDEFLLYKNYFRRYEGERAILHLFRVVSGMDSMVVGEDEILGQVRDAYQDALENKLTDYRLNTIFQNAFTCAKKIKTVTMLSKSSVSIGTLVASEVFHYPMEDKKVLLIGMTGKMGSIICKNLLSKENVLVYGTTREHKKQLETLTQNENLIQVSYHNRYQYIDEADIIISVTSSPHYTLMGQETKTAITTCKGRLFIDLAVPRDIDVEIGKISGVTLRDIDYFETLAERNNALKLREVQVAEEMIAMGVDDTRKELCFHDFLPRLQEFHHFFQAKTPEQLLFQVRDEATFKECETILEVFKRLMEEKQ